MKRIPFIAQILLGLFLPWVSCSDSTGPSFKDPRTYEWTIDTLKAPEPSYMTWLRRIYAAHARDVYAAGFNDYYGRGALWHFDGSRWSSVQWWKPGPERQADFSDVMGFSSSLVYAVGGESGGPGQLNRSLIARYDGQAWNLIELPGYSLETIGGSGPNDIWVAGILNSVFHFDGIA